MAADRAGPAPTPRGGRRLRSGPTTSHGVAARGALLGFVAALVLSACGGGGGSTSAPAAPLPTGAQAQDATLLAGRKVFSAECASCHGARGQGGVGPTFQDGKLLRDFPNAEDQVAFVTQGKGIMPSFAGVLTHSQLESVVAYERQVLTHAK
jgi:mono/diheme cytochrome c family protein